MQEIKITFDIDTKTINKVEGVEDVNPLDVAKILMSVSLTALNKVDFKKKKIIEPKLKIIGGNHVNKQNSL